MLKKRIIPKFLFQFQKINEHLLPTFVISKHFSKLKTIGSIIPQAKIYEAQLADELMILNIADIKCLLILNFKFFKKIFRTNIYAINCRWWSEIIRMF